MKVNCFVNNSFLVVLDENVLSLIDILFLEFFCLLFKSYY